MKTVDKCTPLPPETWDESSRSLGLFAKYWEAGRVKTRLGTSIGMQAAADLHRTFLTQLLHNLGPVDAKRILLIAPDDRIQEMSPHVGDTWEILGQGDGDLGKRLGRFFKSALCQASRVVVIGSDCPLLTHDCISEAFTHLASHPAVLGPSADGGYYLLGLRGSWQPWMGSLFTEIPWSTERVADITRQRFHEAAIHFVELGIQEDIDTLDCLERLDQQLSRSDRGSLLRTSVRYALSHATKDEKI